MKKVHVLLVITSITTAGAVAFAHGGKGKMMDPNGDGKVTLVEAQEAAKKRFSELDKNKDGSLSKDELAAKFSRKFARADADNDGKVTLAEAQTGVKDWFTRKDSNKDGVLTKDEFRRGKHGDKKRRS